MSKVIVCTFTVTAVRMLNNKALKEVKYGFLQAWDIAIKYNVYSKSHKKSSRQTRNFTENLF